MSVFAEYAEVLSGAQLLHNRLPGLLDPETGFAPRLVQICRDHLEQLQDAPDAPASPQDIEILRLEQNTWALLQVLMAARKTSPPETTFTPNPYTPTSTLAQAILRSSPLLTEMVVVREWLHDTAPQPSVPEATTGYLNFTKHAVMQEKRLGRKTNNTVPDYLDPDATNRSASAQVQLASDDASYERSLLQALYAHVRAGRLEDAIELCRRAHQPWRAASMRGLLLFRWNAISTDPTDTTKHDDEGGEEEEDIVMDQDSNTSDIWSGNRHRRLWKATCTRAALNTNLSTPERTLYAALSPSPQTFPTLRAACKTWEDHLWATLSVICEQRESAELDRLAVYFSSFWEDQHDDQDSDSTADVDIPGPGSGELLQPRRTRVTPSPPLPPPPVGTSSYSSAALAPFDEEDWEKEVTATLESLKTAAVAEGPPADDAFHFSQLHIILDRTTTLLDVFAGGLKDGSYGHGMYEYAPLTRFFAHLCLFLKMIDIPVPPLATQTILEAYLRVLEEAGERHLIALYAGALGENAVERYALFLVSLGLAAIDDRNDEDSSTGGDTIEERKRALVRARDHGLDLDRVAVVAAERTVDKAFELLPPTSTKGSLPSLLRGADGPLQRPPSPTEMFLMRSIEWTTFSETTFDTALEQACVILRFFLASGRVKLAQRVSESLPLELASIAEPEERATEYLHYSQFFIVWETLDRVVAFQALEVDMDASRTGSIGASRDTRMAWLSDYRDLLAQACEQVTRLLTAEWLVTTNGDGPISGSYADKRRRELIRIRRVFIPELVIRLHSLLFASRTWFPENLKRALELANVVADSRYKLYEDFLGLDVDDEQEVLRKKLERQAGRQVTRSSTRLADYLSAVRQGVLGTLESGGSDPFAWLTRQPQPMSIQV
ncbi:hypothetical protein M378DRAFT_169919 [Amanita muscaria Koide BX008]|uniref:Nuclear pore complex protein n=1 Tax=Amanita muscaria (strain Koide BX008) TaxID=946122 RepID=A0A0C2WCN0_AMAMK|nr:hypothetical protein M378DRAFT_169919 [Amanita muscaria Koide BX008]